jgi:signal transduction histidine kinase
VSRAGNLGYTPIVLVPVMRRLGRMLADTGAGTGAPRWIGVAWVWLPALAGLLLFGGVAAAQAGGSGALPWWVGGGIVCTAAYAARERWPLGALALSLAVLGAARLPGVDILSGGFGVAYLLLLLVPVLPLVAVSSRLGFSWSLPAVAITIAVEIVISPAPAWSTSSATAQGTFVQYLLTLGVPVMIAVGAWLAGCAMLERQRYAEAVLARAATLERTRDAEAARAVAEERAQVARELHDVVTHTVAVMVVQASAATTVWDHDPEQARAAMTAVQESGRTAMAELRGVLASLDSGRDPVASRATPGLERLSELVDQIRVAGLEAQLTVHGSPQTLPATISLSLLRIAQESVTNALRHARASSIQVELDVGPVLTRLTVVDDGIGYHVGTADADALDGDRQGGRGLIGMRERALLIGGRLEILAPANGGTIVTASAPVTGAGQS